MGKYQQQLIREFNRQVRHLLEKGYPHLAGVKTETFLNKVEPLRESVNELTLSEIQAPAKRIPFVIVVKNEFVAAEAAMPLIKIKGQTGHVNMHPVEPKDFKPIDCLQIPGSDIYLLLDIDTGRDTLNVTPHHALQKLQSENRLPLTIDEGIALVTHFPEVLTDKKTYNCFSMLGSRRDDQRVPALWISYKKPRLGWCWDNNPHTWLGSASCQKRVGA